MKIFVIHSGSNKDTVKDEISFIQNNTVSSEFLMLKNGGKLWKLDAKKMIKQAQMVLLFVGEQSWESPNIAWEISTAKKNQKQIYTIMLSKEYQMPPMLFETNSFTKEKENISKIKSKEDIVNILNTYSAGDYSLFNKSEADIDTAALLEQYKVFLQTSETLVERRQSVNNFYITVNSALVTCFGVISALSFHYLLKCFLGVVFLAIGIVLCTSWIRILNSYGVLNASKMKVISLLEKQLPASLYDAEWRAQSDKLNRRPYISFTSCETRIPKMFICIYGAITVCAIVMAILSLF